MCGIVGLADPRGIDRSRLPAMTGAILHRGPDDEGEFVSRQAGLAMRRLSIIDVAGGHQPMTSEDGSIHVIQNGEIYNYRELAAELAAAGHRFVSRSDTEAIVHAYEQWGDDCLSHLWGMFALAIWDAGRQRLLIARDRLGKKPLYYAVRDGRLAFASELKCFRALDWIDTTPDADALATYATAGFIPAPATIFRGVRKLAAGEALRWEAGRIRTWPWWDVPLHGTAPASRAAAVEELRGLLDDAVTRRLLSDVPVGVLLSSGVDSSVVAALASRAHQGLATFTVGFSEAELDEAHDAERLARRLGTRHQTLVVDAQIADILPDVVWHLDEPLADNAAVPTFLIAREARRHVTVVLTGEGADEIFGGYRYYRWEAAAERYRAATGSGPAGRALRQLARYAGRAGGWKAERFLATAEEGDGRGLGAWTRILDTGLPPLLSAEVRAAAGTADPRGAYQRQWASRPDGDRLNRLLYVDQRTFLPDDLLMKVDRMTMAHSLEARTPFLDHRLVERLATIPSSWKISWRGLTKPLLRDIAQAWLPTDVLARRKRVFATPLQRWLSHDLREMIDEVCNAGSRGSGLVDLDALADAARKVRAGDWTLSRYLWAGVVLELWHAQWQSRPVPAALHGTGGR